jgi:hypothetical protein
MVESQEFATSKRQHVLQRVAVTAAARIADTFSTQRTMSGRLMSRRQIQQQLRAITKVVLSPNSSVQEDDGASDGDDDAAFDADAHALEAPARALGVSNAGTVCSSRVHERVSEGGSFLGRPSAGGSTCDAAAAAAAELPVSARPSDAGDNEEEQDAQQLPSTTATAAAAAAAGAALKRCMTTETDRAVAGSERPPGTPCTPFSPFSIHQPISQQTAAAAAAGAGAAMHSPHHQQAELKLWLDESDVIADIGCEVQYVAQLELAGSKISRHVPLAALARQHKQVLWLQFFLESSYAATFYIFTG